MDKRIKLMPDYGCSPLWEHRDGDLVDNTDPDDLPLPDDLKAALRRWAAAYDDTLNQEYPPESGFTSTAEEEAFEAEGRRLWKELQRHLGPESEVVYYSQHDGRLYEPENGPGPSVLHPTDRTRSREA